LTWVDGYGLGLFAAVAVEGVKMGMQSYHAALFLRKIEKSVVNLVGSLLSLTSRA
jgi:hypothetical protein